MSELWIINSNIWVTEIWNELWKTPIEPRKLVKIGSSSAIRINLYKKFYKLWKNYFERWPDSNTRSNLKLTQSEVLTRQTSTNHKRCIWVWFHWIPSNSDNHNSSNSNKLTEFDRDHTVWTEFMRGLVSIWDKLLWAFVKQYIIIWRIQPANFGENSRKCRNLFSRCSSFQVHSLWLRLKICSNFAWTMINSNKPGRTLSTLLNLKIVCKFYF